MYIDDKESKNDLQLKYTILRQNNTCFKSIPIIKWFSVLQIYYFK